MVWKRTLGNIQKMSKMLWRRLQNFMHRTWLLHIVSRLWHLVQSLSDPSPPQPKHRVDAFLEGGVIVRGTPPHPIWTMSSPYHISPAAACLLTPLVHTTPIAPTTPKYVPLHLQTPLGHFQPHPHSGHSTWRSPQLVLGSLVSRLEKDWKRLDQDWTSSPVFWFLRSWDHKKTGLSEPVSWVRTGLL